MFSEAAQGLAGIFEADCGSISRRSKLIDVEVSAGLQGLWIFGVERQGDREGVAGVVEAVQVNQGRCSVVVDFDRTWRLAGRFFGARKRSDEVACIEKSPRSIEELRNRRIYPGREVIETTSKRTRCRLLGVTFILLACSDRGVIVRFRVTGGAWGI